ncbi:hypothetical protein G6F43_000194 [Rhizopus delemar]|nr:hypothetical protein G6F43_000194 [Rhizopus delemar]
MVAKLKSKFGNDMVFVMVYLIDKFQTSQCCPSCENRSLTTFKRIPNPQPYQRQNNPEVICHGLLRCTNQNSKVTMQNISGVQELCERLWDRDLAACLNMIHIACNLCLNGEIPERFQHAVAERRAPTRRRRSEENENDAFYLEPCNFPTQR